MSMLMPKPPKPDPSMKAAQESQKAAERERVRQLKEEQLRRTKEQMSGTGVRSLISSSGGGFGRNFF